MASEEIDPRPHKYWPSVESLKAYGQKNLQATLLFVDFTKAFDSIHSGKMEQILLAYDLPKETVAAITILYRNTKMKVRSPDGDGLIIVWQKFSLFWVLRLLDFQISNNTSVILDIYINLINSSLPSFRPSFLPLFLFSLPLSLTLSSFTYAHTDT